MIGGEGEARHPNSCRSISNPQLLLLFYLYSTPSFLRVLHFRPTCSCSHSLTRQGEEGTRGAVRTRGSYQRAPPITGGRPRPIGHPVAGPGPVQCLHSRPGPPPRPAGREGPCQGARPAGVARQGKVKSDTSALGGWASTQCGDKEGHNTQEACPFCPSPPRQATPPRVMGAAWGQSHYLESEEVGTVATVSKDYVRPAAACLLCGHGHITAPL